MSDELYHYDGTMNAVQNLIYSMDCNMDNDEIDNEYLGEIYQLCSEYIQKKKEKYKK